MPRFTLATALVLFVLLGAARFGQWGASLTADESYTLNYAFQPVSSIRSAYDSTNNQVLFSLLLRFMDQASPKALLFSPAGVRPLQLPSILASIAALPLLFCVASRLFNRPIALLSVAFLGVSAWHLMYSHMLRAYSLSVFFCLLNIWMLQQALLEGRKRALLALPFGLAAANYLMPTNAYYCAALAPWAAFELYRSRRPRRPGGAADAHFPLLVGAAFLAGAALTVWLYRPILKDILLPPIDRLTWTDSLAATGARLENSLLILGAHRPFRWLVLACAALGAYYLWLSRKRGSGAGMLFLCTLSFPLIALTLQRMIAYPRISIPTLPIWAMLCAAGLYGALALLRLRRALPASAFRPVLLGALGAILLLSSGEAAAVLSWNRGMRIREPLNAAARMARTQDDLVVILPPPVQGAWAASGDAVAWDYHATSVNLRPHERVLLGKDRGYLARRHYYIVSAGDEEAEEAMALSRIDPILKRSLRLAGVFRKLRLYTLGVDASVIEAYKAAAADAGLEPEQRVQALTGLGADAMVREDPEQAVRWLSRARYLSMGFKGDAKVRFLLGMAHYLSFEDRAAAEEFAWVVAHDTHNFHAPLYLADALAEQGRTEEARGWYGWYLRPGAPTESWFLADRARAGAAALRAGGNPRILARPRDADAWTALGLAYQAQGSYERADRALARAWSIRPRSELLFHRAVAHSHLKNYHRASEFLLLADQAGLGVEARIGLAEMLRMKYRLREADALIARALREHPENEGARRIAAELRRMREP